MAVNSDQRYAEYAGGIRVERTLAYLESIPDPLQRIRECEVASDQARTIQGKIAAVRRRGVYEATLRPGSSGESVAAELGVSAKAVSAAISEFRKHDLDLFRRALALSTHSGVSALPPAELSAASSTRDVLFAAKTVLKAQAARTIKGETDDDFAFLEEVAERARSIAATGRVEIPAGARARPPLGQAEPDYTRTPARYLRLAHALNALPMIIGYVAESNLDDSWTMSWMIRPAEPYSTVFDAGPHRDGWASSEWLVWLMKDYHRGGWDLDYYVSSPPPHLNEPGESMSFVVNFPKHSTSKVVDPDELADWIKKIWDQTGYTAIEWPAVLR